MGGEWKWTERGWVEVGRRSVSEEWTISGWVERGWRWRVERVVPFPCTASSPGTDGIFRVEVDELELT